MFSEDELKAASVEMEDGINRYCHNEYSRKNGFRSHLGSSQIGHPCERKLYYDFRWVSPEQIDGRTARLFDRGKREESRWMEWIRGAGYEIVDIDPSTGKQFRIPSNNGHDGGSLDAILTHNKFGLVVAEFKTFATGPFRKVQENGVKIERPIYWAQMCTYGYKLGISVGMFCGSNKNDDDITVQFVNLDMQHGEDMQRKADSIIFAEELPRRISNNSSFWQCKLCPHKAVCHESVETAVNCRSCRMAKALPEGKWHCLHWGSEIPEEYIAVGCSERISV